MGNTVVRETGPVASALSRVRALLPPGWGATVASASSASPLDAVLRLEGPEGGVAEVGLVVKVWPTAPSSAVRGVLAPLVQRVSLPLVLVTDYINAPLREVCHELGVGYVDATGWVSIALAEPLVVLRAEGAARRPGPARQGNIHRLTGRATIRIVIELLESYGPLGVRELSERAGVSPGAVSKLLPTLASEDVIARSATGGVASVRKRRLLALVARDYSVEKVSRRAAYLLYARGVPNLLDVLGSASAVAFSGAAAATAFLPSGVLPVAPTARVLAYVADAESRARDLGALASDKPAANLLLVEPIDRAILDAGGHTAEGWPTARLGRVLLDLMAAAGRESLIAEQIMDALAASDPAWSES